MDATEKMLEIVWREARSGQETVCALCGKLSEEKMREETARELEAYAAIGARAERILCERFHGAPEYSTAQKLTTSGGAKLAAAGISDPKTVAGILHGGMLESVAGLRRSIHEMSGCGCSADALALAQNLAACETVQAERLREWEIR